MSIKKNFFHNILFILSNVLFPIISFSYTSRILGPEGLGKIQFVITFAQYFVLVAALGIPIYGIREVAKARGDKTKLSKLFSELLIINIFSSALLLAIYFVVVFSVGWFQHDIVFYLIGGVIVLSGFSVIDWFFMGMEQFHFLSIRSIIIKGAALLALFLFVKTPKDLLVYFLIIIFSLIGNNLWNLTNLKGTIVIRFRKLELRKHIPALLTLFSTTVIVSIYTMVDTLFLGFITDDKAVGFYTAALKITKISIPLVASLGTVLIPRITQSIVSKDELLLQKLAGQSFSFICLLAIPISLGLFLYAPEIIIVFSGSQYLDAIPTMQIAAPLVILIGLGSIFGPQLLISSGKEKIFFIATVFGMITSVVLNVILIRLFRDKGAAIATIMAELVVTGIAYYFVYTQMKLRFNWGLGLKAVLASLVFIPIGIVVRDFAPNTFIRLGIEIISCTIVYFSIQLFVFKESQIRGVYLNVVKRVMK